MTSPRRRCTSKGQALRLRLGDIHVRQRLHARWQRGYRSVLVQITLVDDNLSLRNAERRLWRVWNRISTSARARPKDEDARMNVEGGKMAKAGGTKRRERNVVRCGWVTAWLLANPHTSYRDIIILYSHPTHSTSPCSWLPRALPSCQLHYALQIVSSVVLRGAIIATTQRLC